MHSHPEEQTGYLVSGHMRLTIGGDTYDIQPGDSWLRRGNVIHGPRYWKTRWRWSVFAPVRRIIYHKEGNRRGRR